jgi:hypothetical protein
LPRTVLERFDEKVDKSGGLRACWEWTGAKNPNGYGVFNTTETDYAHRASWILHRGPIPEGKYVCHSCDNKGCVNPRHLFLGTQADNMADAGRKGKMNRDAEAIRRRQLGEGNSSAKLARTQVDEIRKRYAPGVISQASLGREFGVSQTAVSHIILDKSWRGE